MICVTSVTIYPKNIVLKTGQWYYDTTVEICPTNASRDCVTWHSSNPRVAMVNPSNGYIYEGTAGTAQIYATATDGSGCSDFLTVNVTRNPILVNSVELNQNAISIESGNTYTLSATVCPLNADNKSLTWSTSNANVATVCDGIVTAVSRGNATITARARDGSFAQDCCQVHVTGDILVRSITIEPVKKTMLEGDAEILHATVLPIDATTPCVEWSSSDPDVVSVHATTGLIYAQNAGCAWIYATATDGSNKRGACLITVNPWIPVAVIHIDETCDTIYNGEVRSLSASVLPTNATEPDIRWSSSNPSILSISSRSGVMTAHKLGKVTITVTEINSERTASVEIEVVKRKFLIRRDGGSVEVVLNYGDANSNNERIWKCINYDLIFRDSSDPVSNLEARPYMQRSSFNIYEIAGNTASALREYTDDELRALYIIDPHGVAYYVNICATRKGDGDIAYKDRIFKVLFGRNPNYFRRDTSGLWNLVLYEKKDQYNNQAMLSESETLFGYHVIYDWLTISSLVKFIFSSIAGKFLEAIVEKLYDPSAKDKLKDFFLEASTLRTMFVKSIPEGVVEGGIQLAFNAINMGWILDLVNGLSEFVDKINIAAEFDFNRDICRYCVQGLNHDIYFQLKNEETPYSMNDVVSTIEHLKEQS